MNWQSNDTRNVKNYSFPIPAPLGTQQAVDTVNIATGQNKSPQAITRNLANYITPVQLERIAQDVAAWRSWINEAELAYYPHRVKMQRGYIDTVLNGHVFACMDRRKDLTLLRKFEFYTGDDETGPVEEEITKWFKKRMWFKDFITYAIDAIFYGYTLLSLGDISDDDFKDIKIIKRWNISPDRYNVTAYIYSLNGADWRDPKYKPWHIYIPTTSESGASPCGYGLLYKVALYEIILRGLLGNNMDFVELYAQPYRVGKTNKTTESERGEFEQALQNMGSSGWAVIEPTDEIEFLETALGGTGWKGYENLEQRCQKIISKIILGHADALDSVPGKLGNDNEKSPAQKAMEDKQTKDGDFIESVINEQLIPHMIELGFKFPEGLKIRYKNDAEVAEINARDNAANKAVADTVKVLKDSGHEVSAEWITERTSIDLVINEVTKPDIEAAARANLRGSVGGVQGIVAIQQSVADGKTTREAAIATLKYVYGYEDAEAAEMVGTAKVVVPQAAPVPGKVPGPGKQDANSDGIIEPDNAEPKKTDKTPSEDEKIIASKTKARLDRLYKVKAHTHAV